MLKRKHNRNLTVIAKEMRKNMTKQEFYLWTYFLKKYEVRILRQKVIDKFVVDFYCAKAKLVIEVDGGHHFTEENKEYDAERTKVLNDYGIKVIRFANSEIDNNFDNVCLIIDEEVKRILNP